MTNTIPTIDCNAQIKDENDLSAWANVNKSFTYFKCAKLRTFECESYLVKHIN